jgi:hypothetical protein
MMHLSVNDTGCGMNEMILRRAVEPFFSTKEVGKGTGLGLSMACAVIRQWGGDFSVREPGWHWNKHRSLAALDGPIVATTGGFREVVAHQLNSLKSARSRALRTVAYGLASVLTIKRREE